ncbi:MAG: hypothetical protein K5846_09530 [Bacteroidales bacterium]|nr:hypothetical protein [Bacteroidales bacterium]
MKKSDFIVIAIVVVFLAPFFLFDAVYDAYCAGNKNFPLWMAFLKFGILATFGEMLGNRIKNGQYYHKGFGLLPKFIVWGLLGMWIALAMSVFRIGIPGFMERYQAFSGISAAMNEPFSGLKLLGAFCVSVMMNTAFAPVFMTVHKICDMHIAAHDGRVSALVKPMPVKQYITQMDWGVQWGFVFKKTIPLFWIPAHTLTFCLPQDMQVLFAALCSVILGLFLSIAAMKRSA